MNSELPGWKNLNFKWKRVNRQLRAFYRNSESYQRKFSKLIPNKVIGLHELSGI